MMISHVTVRMEHSSDKHVTHDPHEQKSHTTIKGDVMHEIGSSQGLIVMSIFSFDK